MGKKIDFRSIYKWIFLFALALLTALISAALNIFPLAQRWKVILVVVGIMLGIIGLLQLSLFGFKKLSILIMKPNLKCSFELKGENDLWLIVLNKKRKDVIVKFTNYDILTSSKKPYLHEFPNTLKLTRASASNIWPLYEGPIIRKAIERIRLGLDFDGKIALRYKQGDAPVYGFVDGEFEYVIACKGLINDVNFSRLYNVGLVIKDGALVEIK
jgi:hypothetical protein